jgi:hypothetical protein
MYRSTRLLLILYLVISSPLNAQAQREALLIPIDEAIGAATGEYVVHGLEAAQASNVELVILRLDTPGGLDKAMRRIIKAILASEVPVVGFVAPPGHGPPAPAPAPTSCTPVIWPPWPPPPIWGLRHRSRSAAAYPASARHRNHQAG